MKEFTKKYFADILLVLVAIIWGSGFIAAKVAIDSSVSPSTIMTIRFVISAVIVSIVFNRKLRQTKRREIVYGIVTGVFLFLAFFLQTIALLFTTPSNNAFLTATNVVMVPFISWLILKRKPQDKIIFAAFLSLSGVGVLTISTSFDSFNKGDLLTLLCGVMFACHIFYTSRVVNNIGVQKLICIQMITAAILSVFVFLLMDFENFEFSVIKSGLLASTYLGVFSTCLAFFLQTLAQKYSKASKVAVILSLEAVFGSLFSVIFRFEVFSLKMIIGGVLVMSSILILERNNKEVKQ